MLNLISGPFEDLSPVDREAINALTVGRYVADIIGDDNELIRARHPEPSSPKSGLARRSHYRSLANALRRVEKRT
jgi:hypothetical protein